MDIWEELYNKAKAVQNGRNISPLIYGGQVAAAILTKAGNIYTGVCVDAPCSLGICAERNAIFQMITAGESTISKIIAIMPDGKAGPPCGACSEIMMQLDKESGDIEVMLNYETRRTAKLANILPDWWGKDRISE